MAQRPLVIAHRGFSARFPENTLAAIRGAIKVGADMVEIDVQETGDGRIAVFHDMLLRRLCGVPGRICQVPLAEVLKSKPDIPSLTQVLAAVRDRAPLLIEIKSADATKVAHSILKARMEHQVIVFAFDVAKLETLSRVAPGIPRFGLVADDLSHSVRALKRAVNVEGIGVASRLLNCGTDVRQLQRQIGRVFVWTVNTAHRMRQLATWKVDGIITNRPELACQTLRNLEEESGGVELPGAKTSRRRPRAGG